MTTNAQALPVQDPGYVRPRAPMRVTDVRIDMFLFLLGCWWQLAVYESLQPSVAAALFWIAGTSTLWLTRTYLRLERAMFARLFSIGWFMAGIAAVYANLLQDPLQLASDAATFFDLARGESVGLALEDIREITEGAGAVVLWRSVYDFFAGIGFEKGRYIGILMNVTCVALAGVVALRMARLVYGSDQARLRRLILIFSSCGLLWLFSAIHLRDSLVFLTVTANCFVWVRYLVAPRVWGLAWLALANILFFLSFAFLRSEFVFVPIAMFLAALGAVILTRTASGRQRPLVYAAFAFSLILTGLLYVNLGDELIFALTRGTEGYLAHSAEEAAADSLGMALVVNQALPIRLVLGSAYLFVFPIPFWSGFQLESASPLFKSANVLFFYALTPLLLLSLVRIWHINAQFNRVNVFLALVAFGFTLGIAGTSLETRHFGAFLAPFFVLALLPDLSQPRVQHVYKRWLSYFLALMAVVHVAWAVLTLAK